MRPSGPYRRQLVVNTLASVAANGWTMVLALVSVPLLLQGLGPTAYGTWALLLTFSATTGWLSLADLGIGGATVRAVAAQASKGDRDGLGHVIGTSLATYMTLGTAFAALFALAGPALLPTVFNTPDALRGELVFAIKVFSAQVLLDLLASGVLAAMEGLQRLDLARLADSTRRTLVVVATGTAALTGAGLRGVAIASLAATTIGVTVAAALGRRCFAGRLRLRREDAAGLLRYGVEVGMLRATGVLHRTMDRLIVGAVLGPAEVALVEIATQIQNSVAAILSATTHVAAGSASWIQARADRATLRRLLLIGTRYSTAIVVPLAVLGMILARPIVHSWVGEQYSGAVILTVLGLLYLAIQAPLQMGSNLLQGTGDVRAILRPALVAVLVNVASSLALVHVLGAPGVFVGTLVGALVLTPALLRTTLRRADLSTRQFGATIVGVVPVCVAVAAVAWPVALAPWSDPLRLAIGFPAAAVVGLAASLKWTMPPEDLRELRHALLSR